MYEPWNNIKCVLSRTVGYNIPGIPDGQVLGVGTREEIKDHKVGGEKGGRAATLRQKQNSLTFYWLFPDQIQFFTDQNTAVLRPICLLAADKLQIPFTCSLKCTPLILQMKQIKSLNSLLAQNVLKLTSFHSFERATEKNQYFSSNQNTCYSTYFRPKLWNSLTFLVFKISLTNLQNSLTLKNNQISLTSGHPGGGGQGREKGKKQWGRKIDSHYSSTFRIC